MIRWLGLAGVVLVDGGALDSVVGLPDLGVVVVNGGALDFSVEARRGGFSVEARCGGDSVAWACRRGGGWVFC